ncbi:unnamed protein product, partial [Amoebophrya sp. A25]
GSTGVEQEDLLQQDGETTGTGAAPASSSSSWVDSWRHDGERERAAAFQRRRPRTGPATSLSPWDRAQLIENGFADPGPGKAPVANNRPTRRGSGSPPPPPSGRTGNAPLAGRGRGGTSSSTHGGGAGGGSTGVIRTQRANRLQHSPLIVSTTGAGVGHNNVRGMGGMTTRIRRVILSPGSAEEEGVATSSTFAQGSPIQASVWGGEGAALFADNESWGLRGRALEVRGPDAEGAEAIDYLHKNRTLYSTAGVLVGATTLAGAAAGHQIQFLRGNAAITEPRSATDSVPGGAPQGVSPGANEGDAT